MSRVIIAGGQNLAPALLRYLMADTSHEVVCAICRTDDTGEDAVFPSLIKVARSFDIPYIRPESIASPKCAEKIIKYGADIIISAMYDQILKKRLIDQFGRRLGIINIHYAPLPRYSGFWPEMWAIWNNEKTHGVTIHYISEGVDAGEIIAQSLFGIDKRETRKSLYLKCDTAAIGLFKKFSPIFLKKKIKGRPQKQEEKTYFKRELPNKGFIDPSWDYQTIERFIRATTFHPFVGAKFRIGSNVFSVVGRDIKFFKPYTLTQEKK
ncbi:MAG: hypothetical protein KKH34_07855 [Candidatus Omnitrophica bacterium]|nr:hypothetical protein [Candidatus Omnitrophota bacterium]